MQEIAEDEQAARAGARDETGEPREIGGGRPARKRDAGGTKRRTLAEMHVGDEERFLAGPVERTLGAELHALSGDRRVQHTVSRGVGITGLEFGCGAHRVSWTGDTTG